MGSLFWGSSITHISTTTACIDMNIFALNFPCSDLSNEPAYVSARCVVVARRPDLHRHGHGTVPPNLPPPYPPFPICSAHSRYLQNTLDPLLLHIQHMRRKNDISAVHFPFFGCCTISHLSPLFTPYLRIRLMDFHESTLVL